MMDLTRHVLLDLELAGEGLAMYSDDGEMTGVGLAGVICTWLWVVLMLSGVAWFANLPSSFMPPWSLLGKGRHKTSLMKWPSVSRVVRSTVKQARVKKQPVNLMNSRC